jgi:SAM-dependent methyltransferase
VRRLRRVSALALLPARAVAATRHAARAGAPGLEFARFGRRAALRIAAREPGLAARLAVTPVNIIRYFEFAFVWSCLPSFCDKVLDVGSPRLFTLYAASRGRARSLTMINPDAADLEVTRRLADALRLPVLMEARGVETVGEQDRFDCIWAISVLEHIHGEFDDTDAVIRLYRAIRPGGRLILTVPVDRRAHNEFRRGRYFAGGAPDDEEARFFQRWYDEPTLRERLVAPTGGAVSLMRWFGETTPGRFAEHEAAWQARGHLVTVDDPREIADHYREYPNWDTMPGVGVCGILFEKPVAQPSKPPPERR